MRYSKQKDEVLKVVLDACNHPDAKEVYNLVKKKIPNISLGTVYRNLNALCTEGKIIRILMKDGNDRFDKTLTDHNHVMCVKCGKVCDVSLLLGSDKLKKIENETGFKITGCNFNINGICKDCTEGRN